MRAIADTINGFFERYEVPWEIFMMSLAVVFVVIGFIPESPFLTHLNLSITAFFILEFSVRFFAAPSKRGYVRGHWIDLLALIPAIRFFRLLRVARVLRLMRLPVLFRFFASADRVRGHIKGISIQNGLHWVLVAIAVIMLICAGGVYLVEAGQNPAIDAFDDALWWSVVTLTTVGYGDVYAITGIGRIFSAVLMTVGIILWAMITSSIATYFLSLRKAKDPTIEELKQKLDRLDELSDREIAVLRASFDAILMSRGNPAPGRKTSPTGGEQGQS